MLCTGVSVSRSRRGNFLVVFFLRFFTWIPPIIRIKMCKISFKDHFKKPQGFLKLAQRISGVWNRLVKKLFRLLRYFTDGLSRKIKVINQCYNKNNNNAIVAIKFYASGIIQQNTNLQSSYQRWEIIFLSRWIPVGLPCVWKQVLLIYFNRKQRKEEQRSFWLIKEHRIYELHLRLFFVSVWRCFSWKYFPTFSSFAEKKKF